MIHKGLNEKERQELKKILNHYLDKREDNMKSTEISYLEIVGDILGKNVSVEQITKLNNFCRQNDVNINFNRIIILFNRSKKCFEKSIKLNALPEFSIY